MPINLYINQIVCTVRKIQQFSVIKLSHDSQNKEIKAKIDLEALFCSCKGNCHVETLPKCPCYSHR